MLKLRQVKMKEIKILSFTKALTSTINHSLFIRPDIFY